MSSGSSTCPLFRLYYNISLQLQCCTSPQKPSHFGFVQIVPFLMMIAAIITMTTAPLAVSLTAIMTIIIYYPNHWMGCHPCLPNMMTLSSSRAIIGIAQCRTLNWSGCLLHSFKRMKLYQSWAWIGIPQWKYWIRYCYLPCTAVAPECLCSVWIW